MKFGNKSKRGSARRSVCLLLNLCLAASGLVLLTGCGSEAPAGKQADAQGGKTVELTAKLTAQEADTAKTAGKAKEDFDEEKNSLIDASFKLFKQSADGQENTLLSPLSLLMALTMTAQGAQGETREQIESALGQDLENLAAYFADYVSNLPQGKKAELHIGNSIWIRDEADRLTVEDDFLRAAKENFQAQVFRSAFDEETVRDINRWCEQATDGMIKELVQEIKPEEVIHLLNAISFDAKWAEPYEKRQIGEDRFKTEAGERQTHEYLYSKENIYLEGEHETGFMKPYRKGYRFVALLPEEGMSMADYLKTLSGKRFRHLLDTASDEPVETALPSFEISCGLELAPALQAMGMEDLMNPDKADLSGMATSTIGKVFVSHVVQKTYMKVDAQGTRTAAATDVIAADTCALQMDRIVYLTRPFVYGIIEENTGMPVFLGTMMRPA